MNLEDLKPSVVLRGIVPDAPVTVSAVTWFGSEALEITFKDAAGKLGNELLYRHDEPRLELLEVGRPWSFDGDGGLFRLVSEAHRIRLAHLFDPVLAVHTSVVEPLPHQITAVYEAMLPRQPLRFLLADDPGAGKTIMAGLLMKELIARGDLARCLVVCPGSLAEQWQDELYRRFNLPFEILTNDKLESARTGNWFFETNLIIARLDKLSRNEDVQAQLSAPDCRFDLIVCDEAHKMSATWFGGEIKYTKRYKLGRLLSTLTRHFLLMTATPHNGKEEDFQLFMALLDGDRFEGRFRDGVHTAGVEGLMRRMVKESLLKFDATPLFPERVANTVPYRLSDPEARLYREVTQYVREEFNRAEALLNDKRAGTVGFALTVLQRRLASSPEAIYQSLRRRKERLEGRLRELELLKRGADVATQLIADTPLLDEEDLEDLDEAPEEEVDAAEATVLDQATAARSIQELKSEIETLVRLEALAQGVRRSGEDRKWRELAGLLGEIFTPAAIADRTAEGTPPYDAEQPPKPVPSPRQKLVVFTEHRDTLSYLADRTRTLLGREEAVVTIHGGMGREERMKVQEAFRHDPEVQVLLATDAAEEGINLQRAHLMVNYDLPWNPNRLEQRFGRIHRIGQTEVCHLWNLVAEETREGDVYRTLLVKLEEARRMAAAAERREAPEVSEEDLLAAALLRGLLWREPLSGEHYATAAGIVLLAKDPSAVFPQCRILADAYRGAEPDGEPRDHEDIRAPMPLAIDRALAFVDRNTRHPMRVVGLNRIRIDEYPTEALREAVVNAVAHRQYEDAGRKILLEVFSDRVVVSSPGLPPAPITLMTQRKKLIEVALPLDAINKASAREKSIRHGHPSTLHLWWARRPLAAARAVIFAQMVDDPSSWPDLFPTEKKQEQERKRLFKILSDLVLWENTTNEEVLQKARDEIWRSWRRGWRRMACPCGMGVAGRRRMRTEVPCTSGAR